MTELTYIDVKRIRDRAAHYLSGEVASCIGISLGQLQQVVAGTQQLSDDQWRTLARRMRMET